MEFNTSERRINEDVKAIFEDAHMRNVVQEVSQQYKYQLIKISDAAKYLESAEFVAMFDAIEPFLKKIEEGRELEGKPRGNDYIVINKDEPYINDIIAILAKNGHWEDPVDENNTIDRYEQALNKILEEAMPECEGWETTIVKTAREALGISKEEYWEYDEPNECNWCDTETNELSGPHLLDFAPGASMCRSCWEHDRESYLGSLGTDIGEFQPRKEKSECQE